MEWLWIVLSLLAILAVSMYRQQEHMTNKDVQSALQKYAGTADTASKYESTGVSEYPIYGPKARPPEPKPAPGPGGDGRHDSRIYPDIYGPDVELIPGTKPRSNKHKSDDTSDPIYEFNPDLQKAFPTSGPPQPFLTDFSGFQR